MTLKIFKGSFLDFLKKRKAVTVIELIIVISIISIILSISVVALSKFNKARELDSATQQIKLLLETARSYAVTRNENYKVVFDIAEGKFFLADGTTSTRQDRIYILPRSVVLNAPSEIEFIPSGGLRAAVSDVTVTSKGSSKNKTLSIAPTTGAARIS